jgi:hypothetical protein
MGTSLKDFLPPPLRWFDSFAGSTGRALGQGISHSVQVSVNPLVYKVKLKWPEPVDGKIINGIWNLLQIWTVKNDCVTDGQVDTSSVSLKATIIVKRRLGPPKDVVPWG